MDDVLTSSESTVNGLVFGSHNDQGGAGTFHHAVQYRGYLIRSAIFVLKILDIRVPLLLLMQYQGLIDLLSPVGNEYGIPSLGFSMRFWSDGQPSKCLLTQRTGTRLDNRFVEGTVVTSEHGGQEPAN